MFGALQLVGQRVTLKVPEDRVRDIGEQNSDVLGKSPRKDGRKCSDGIVSGYTKAWVGAVG